MPNDDPAAVARDAGLMLAGEWFAIGRGTARGLSADLIAALGLLALKLAYACIQARRDDRQPDPTPADLRAAARELRDGGGLAFWRWPRLRRTRRALEAAARRPARMARRAGKELPPADAVDLALRATLAATDDELARLLRAAKSADELGESDSDPEDPGGGGPLPWPAWLALVALALMPPALSGCSGGGPLPAPKPAPGPIRDGAAEAVSLVAARREAAGLPPLAHDERLAIMARDQAAAMANAETPAHDLPGRPPFGERLRRSGYRGGGGEVVARAYTAAGAVELWMRSPGHRAIILAPEGRAIGSGQAGAYRCVVVGY